MIKSLKEIWEYRELLAGLVLKDVKLRYKQTLLGIAWAVFSPLTMMLIFSFVFSRVAPISTGRIPYPIFVYCGLVAWYLFANSLSSAVPVLVSNAGLVTKVYFPREVFPLSSVLSKLVDFFLALALLFLLMPFFGIKFTPALLWIPVILFVQLAFTFGLALLFSMGNLFFRDVKYIFDSVIVIWMFATPVIYPINSSSGPISCLLALNPMIPLVDAYRGVVFEGALLNAGPFLIAAVIAFLVLAAGLTVFHKMEYLFAERI
ncbi:MAG: ABC transporter permease [Candidatus Firestonebacteria bacterium]